MKRTKRLALAALTGTAAAVLVWLSISGVRADAAQKEQEAFERYGGSVTKVCVATRDISPNEEIDDGNVEVVEWVSSLLPSNAITSLSEAAGKVSTSRIPKGAPLSTAYFEQSGGELEIPKGKVALSVAIDAEHAVGGTLSRGAVVDVYVSSSALANRLTQAEILDSSSLSAGGGKLSWVTLAVDPSAVQELIAATTQGSVWLIAPGEDSSPANKKSDSDNQKLNSNTNTNQQKEDSSQADNASDDDSTSSKDRTTPQSTTGDRA